MTMRIGMVLCDSKSFPHDIRVEKEAGALLAAGFEVAVMCRRMSDDEPEHEVLDSGLRVFRATPPPDRVVWRVRKKLRMVLGTFSGAVEQWEQPIRDFVSAFGPEVLHGHDLTSVPTVLTVGEEAGLPVVADLHENMPAAYAAYARSWRLDRKLAFHLVHGYGKWHRLEKRALRRCQRIIVVVPEGAERLLRDYAIPPERITIVSNTEDEETFNLGDPDPEIMARYRDRWCAVYVGGGGPHRGLGTAIEAAAVIGDRVPGFCLLLVGIGERKWDQVRALVDASGGRDRIEMVGWVPFEKVNSYIAASRAGLVPHTKLEHTDTTVPHKLFQYMILGRPVIVSDCAPLKRIVEETQTGLVFRADDPYDLADSLVRLYEQEKGGSCPYGPNGRRATIGGPYSWKNDAARLVGLYRELARGAR